MQLTSGSDYGLRGLLYLARQPAGRFVIASEIADAEKMPEYFFSKIFQNLAKAGIVNSVRGSNGGFSLAKSPDEISVLDVIEAIEGPIALSKCVGAPSTCEKSGVCPFHTYWKDAQESLVSIFSKHTLAEAVSYAEVAERRAGPADPHVAR